MFISVRTNGQELIVHMYQNSIIPVPVIEKKEGDKSVAYLVGLVQYKWKTSQEDQVGQHKQVKIEDGDEMETA